MAKLFAWQTPLALMKHSTQGGAKCPHSMEEVLGALAR